MKLNLLVILGSVGVVAGAWARSEGDVDPPVPLAAPAPAAPDGVDLDTDLRLGSAIRAENATVWPVYSRRPADKVGPDLVPLADAQDQGWAVVREELEAGGTVNELVIENRGKRPILVLAGTLVKGGKQDRQIGQDFVVAPGKTVPVAAFCVEHGRWTTQREGVATGGLFKAQKALATQAVRGSGQYNGQQQQVWDNVAKENASAGKAPASGTLMATMDDGDPDSVARRARLSKRLSERFAALAGDDPAPIGLAYAIDGKVREVRTFSHPVLFQRLVETLINTVVVEADLAQRVAKAAKRPPYEKVADRQAVVDLVRHAVEAQSETLRPKAGNVLGVRRAKDAWNSDCFENDAQAVPVTRSFMNAL